MERQKEPVCASGSWQTYRAESYETVAGFTNMRLCGTRFWLFILR
jgi:hypothetical protein